MMIQYVLRPNRMRLALFSLLALIAVAAHIQAWAFSQVGPKPPLYGALAPFPFWAIWVYLVMPLIILSWPLKAIGINVWSGPFWAFIVVNAVYFYLISCVMSMVWDWWKGKGKRAG